MMIEIISREKYAVSGSLQFTFRRKRPKSTERRSPPQSSRWRRASKIPWLIGSDAASITSAQILIRRILTGSETTVEDKVRQRKSIKCEDNLSRFGWIERPKGSLTTFEPQNPGMLAKNRSSLSSSCEASSVHIKARPSSSGETFRADSSAAFGTPWTSHLMYLSRSVLYRR
jgi:hypothetical protein